MIPTSADSFGYPPDLETLVKGVPVKGAATAKYKFLRRIPIDPMTGKPPSDPPPIVYTADIFDAESLELVIRENIHVNCGSPDMIDQYGSRAPGREITLRINPGFGHGHSRKTNTGGDCSKHGIWHGQLAECLVAAEHYGLTVTGLHMHIGSGTDLEHLSQVCAAMEKAALEVGRSLRSISAGGGLPIPYRENESYIDLGEYFRLWDATRTRLHAAFGHPIRLEIEPGRYLVAESGYLVAEIRAVKRQAENTFYLLDAGFNNLARPILYGSYHPMSVVPADGNAAIVVATPERAEELSTQPKIAVRLLGFGQARAPLALMPEATVPAARRALEQSGLAIGQIDAIKTHNPFALNDLLKEVGLISGTPVTPLPPPGVPD